MMPTLNLLLLLWEFGMPNSLLLALLVVPKKKACENWGELFAELCCRLRLDSS